MSNNLMAIVLAAGKGTRMKSEQPKVLFPVLERPMIDYVLDALDAVPVARTVVVVGYRADLVREALARRAAIEFADQTEQLGTGHAVMMCREQLRQHDGPVLIVTGDSPLTQTDSIQKLLSHFERESMSCLLGTLTADDPSGLGRIVRDERGRFERIVEEKDATEAQRAIREVNMSTYLFDAGRLLWALDHLTDDNRQKEYYVTDCPGILLQAGDRVDALPVLKPCEALSINRVEDIPAVEAALRGSCGRP